MKSTLLAATAPDWIEAIVPTARSAIVGFIGGGKRAVKQTAQGSAVRSSLGNRVTVSAHMFGGG